MEKKISVIVPVYNTEKYLKQCIESILNSTYRNFEIILVNDGSTDRSEKICRYYSKKDPRVKVLNQEHSGVSTARNKGIDSSEGEWIVFVDSDDRISRGFLEAIMERECQNQALLIFDQTNGCSENTGRHGPVYYFKKSDTTQIIEKMLCAKQLTEESKISLYSPYAKAYRKSIINQHSIRFPSDIFISEDKIFNLEYLLRTEACLYIPETAYFVQWRPESATHSFHRDFLKNHYAFQHKLENILRKNNIFEMVERAYYENVQAAMTEVLIYGIFNPYSTRTYYENCRLCHKVRNERTYKRAIKQNGITGIMPRRVLLFFLNAECYLAVNLICKLSYIVLRKLKR